MIDRNHDSRPEELIFGRNPVYELLRSGQPVNKLFIAKGVKSTGIQTILELARQQGVVYQFVARQWLDQRCEGPHQGVAALPAAQPYATVKDILERAAAQQQAPFVVVLDQVQDPHNLGSILRTAEAAGVDGVIIPKRRAVGLTPTVAKTSAGATAYVAVAQVANLVRTLDELKQAGLWIVGVEAEASRLFHSLDYREGIALVIGSEGGGIRPLVRKQCDFRVSIPMGGRINSLNASVAAALVIYEVYRQRAFKKLESPRCGRGGRI